MIRAGSNLELVRSVAKCTVPGQAATGPTSGCGQLVRVGVFFDGTGQNKDRAEEVRRKSHSNIARLWSAHKTDRQAGIFKIYNSGPGTPVEVSNPRWWEYLPLTETAGLAAGFGGDARLAKAEADLREQLASVQRIKQVELSVFGFSRGAALARGFVNRILGKCQNANGEWLLDGKHPVVFKFLGIFDTVASFGLPATNLDTSDVCLDVPLCVEKVRHFVAAHELRFSFPLDTIRANGKYPAGDRLERVYPGVHSDVGGGYSPEEQGRAFDLAKIICNDMLIECWNAGLPMASKREIEADKILLGPMFDYPETSYKIYSDYLASVKAKGTVEEQLLQHCLAYYRYRGHSAKAPDAQEPAYQAMDRRADEAQRSYSKAGQTGRRDLQHQASVERDSASGQRSDYKGGDRGIAGEAQQLAFRHEVSQASPMARALVMVGSTGPMGGVSPAAASQTMPLNPTEKRMLQSWQQGAAGAAPLEECKFFESFVHDSKAHFLPEPTGYLRQRGVYQSNFVPIEQRVTTNTNKRAAGGR